jgi:DNA-binding HxlR family transcriptional regulator
LDCPVRDALGMVTHGQYCPVSFAADLIGDRWTLLIMRELIGGATRFNELERCLPKVSRSLLSQRLAQMTRAGLVETTPARSGRGNEYRASAAGIELAPILMAMGDWAVRWVVGEPRPEELDPQFIMFWLHRTVRLDQVPDGRTVVRFDIVDAKREVFWLVLQRDESSICMSDPGLPVDVAVEADNLAFHRVFAGRITLQDAMRDRTITLRGPSTLTRALPNWFGWSPFYEYTRAHLSSVPTAVTG